MTKHTPTPYYTCNEGKCPCKQIWCDNHPIAKVESGEWGDKYPSIRLTGDSLALKAEPFIDKIAYGEIPEEVAQANAEFIVRACNSYDSMVEALEKTITELNDYIGGWQAVERAYCPTDIAEIKDVIQNLEDGLARATGEEG